MGSSSPHISGRRRPRSSRHPQLQSHPAGVQPILTQSLSQTAPCALEKQGVFLRSPASASSEVNLIAKGRRSERTLKVFDVAVTNRRSDVAVGRHSSSSGKVPSARRVLCDSHLTGTADRNGSRRPTSEKDHSRLPGRGPALAARLQSKKRSVRGERCVPNRRHFT